MRPAHIHINLDNLAFNYHLLEQAAAPSRIMAVVKANAYGHGLVKVTETLFHEGCRHFAVTHASEGATLRSHLPIEVRNQIDIIVLSGLFGEKDALLALQHRLSPVLSELSQLAFLQSINFTGNVWLKVDTGMQRIGTIHLDELIEQINHSSMQVAGVMSHLACADTPEHPMNQQQVDNFRLIQKNCNVPAFSLLNSAGIAQKMQVTTEFVRPGLALYGAEPIPSQPMGLKPVMQLSSKIIQLRPISKGESVSYGATWVADKDSFVAIVALGYADGLPRLLSNHGNALHKSGLLPIIGRVCMDYCFLEVAENKAAVGDEVIFFGYAPEAPLANDVAEQAQTIAYELFTGIGSRVEHSYIKENA